MSSSLPMWENVQTNIKGKIPRSSRSQMFFKIAVLKNFAVLSRKHLCWSLFLIKLACTFIKNDYNTVVFSVNIMKFLRTAFL